MTEKRRYRGPGGESAIKKLQDLGFDPIEAQVMAYKEIDHECKQQELIRDKKLIRLRGDGKEKAYSVDFHMMCIDRRAAIAEKLTRYMYARVPESNELNVPGLPSLNINLTDSDEGFTINPAVKEDSDEDVDQST